MAGGAINAERIGKMKLSVAGLLFLLTAAAMTQLIDHRGNSGSSSDLATVQQTYQSSQY